MTGLVQFCAVAVVAAGIGALGLGELDQVVAGAEGAAGPGEHDDVDRGIGVGGGDGGLDLAGHGLVDGVQTLRAVERDAGDPAVGLVGKGGVGHDVGRSSDLRDAYRTKI